MVNTQAYANVLGQYTSTWVNYSDMAKMATKS